MGSGSRSNSTVTHNAEQNSVTVNYVIVKQYMIQAYTEVNQGNVLNGEVSQGQIAHWKKMDHDQNCTRIPRKASSHLLAQKSQEPQSECGN